MPLSFRELLDKYLSDSLTNEETLLFNELAHEPANQAEMAQRIDEQLNNEHHNKASQSFLKDINFTMIRQRISEQKRNEHTGFRLLTLSRWWWAAASIILLTGTAIFLVMSSKQSASSRSDIAESAEVQPGRNGAILTLSDGKQLVLDSLGNGVIALQGGAKAIVVNGALEYEASGNEVVYNTMSTPKGRQFHLKLPDGTGVWLNNASSIRYPTVFAGGERRVQVSGEAYFEVKKMNTPFLVNINDQAEIRVLGTHFNVSSYANEGVMTATLLEGAVQVSRQGEKVKLSPGQQARMVANQVEKPGLKTQPVIEVIPNADVEKVMAWKNGAFNFNNTSFDDAMRQLERWYDISVVYEKGIPKNIELYGEITKDVTLNGLLNALKKIGVKCRLENRTLFIQA